MMKKDFQDFFSFKSAVRISGFIPLCLGILSLTGWMTGTFLLVNLKAAYVPMSVATAVSCIGFGLLLLFWEEVNRQKKLSLASRILVIILSLYGICKSLEPVIGITLTLDDYFFQEKIFSGQYLINRMSPYAGILFFLSGISVLLTMQPARSNKMINISSAAGAIVALTGFISTLGYLFGTPLFYGTRLIPLSFPACISLLSIGCGLILVAGSRNFILRYFVGNSPSSSVIRVIVPLIIAAILLDNLLNTFLTEFFFVNESILLTLVTVILMIATVIIIIRITRKIFKQAELAEHDKNWAMLMLKRSEEEHRMIIENQGEGIGIVDKDEKIVFANPAAEQIFGVPQGTLIGRNIFDFVLPKYIPVLRQETKKRSKAEKSTYEIEIIAGDGEERFLLVTATPQFDESGLFIGTFGIFRNNTDKRKMEEILRQSEERFRKLAETATDGIIAIDLKGNIRLFNLAAEKIFGYSKDEVTGKSIDMFVPENFDIRHENKINQYLRTGITTVIGKTVELNALRKDQSAFPIELSLSEIRVGKELTFIGLVRDITERKLAEEKLEKFTRELAELNATKDKFFSIIAHDLKNPFNLLLGFSEILMEDLKSGNYQDAGESSRRINEVSRSTLRLLENLLTWAQVQTGRIRIQKSQFILLDEIAPELSLLTEAAKNKEISLDIQIRRPLTLFGDRNMIKTVIRNLVSNAIKFSHPGGKVILSSEEKGKNTIISVTDNGTGMSPEETAKLFNIALAKSKPGTGNEKGTGLGLVLCREFIVLHGGTIEVESEPGKGSRFFFMIPAEQ